jgi:4-alpha-glucanotransferase
MERASGILLHITSLPGKSGIGDLGPEAYRFADFLRDSGQHYWQMLPVGPTGFGNVPYQCSSVFAGNPLLIGLEPLVEDGLLEIDDLRDIRIFPESSVDFAAASGYKIPLIEKACREFDRLATGSQKSEFEQFCMTNSVWLDDFAVFMALKEAHNLAAWNTWEEPVRLHQPDSLNIVRSRLAVRIRYHKYQQYFFDKQWHTLKKYCNSNGISLIGDIPIFTALDSADVWAHPGMFYLDDRGMPTVVAGVPPDYFSKTGQLWGNPLYRWDVMKEDGYRWWLDRIRYNIRLFDLVRIDHFRGFARYWEIPRIDKTAERGCWQPGPGAGLFEKLEQGIGKLPVIAEDLGVITPDVEALRDRFGFPGMRVLLFAFSGDAKKNLHLPYLHRTNCVVYTGTHDNTTVKGWFHGEDTGATTQTDAERQDETRRALAYLGTDGSRINWDFIRLAMTSVADTAIIPLQDILGLGNEARMNTPGTTHGNWQWRFPVNMLTDEIKERLKNITEISGRL